MPTKPISAFIAVWCFVAAGCAAVTNEPTTDASTTTAESSAAATTTPLEADVAATPEPSSLAPLAALPGSTEDAIEQPPAATQAEPAPPSVSPENIASESSELAVVAPVAPVTEESEPAPIPSVVASPTSDDALDFSSLATRLRKTKAIDLRTKVAVKHESDDLLEQARAYHAQTGEMTLGELRRSYDSLFYKLHSLLEDGDPPLARDIDRSRAAIWELLADPRKFNASRVMTGA